MPLPPWLDIHPTDYMRAIESGDAAGRALAEAQNRADEAKFQRWMQGQQLREQALHLVAEQQRQKTAAEQTAVFRQANLARYATSETERERHDRAMEGKGAEKKFHFGPHGEVLSVDPQTAAVEILRQGNPTISYRGPHVTLPKDENDVVMSGPADNPEIAARLKQLKQLADDEALKKEVAAKKAAEPNLLEQGWSGIKSMFSAPGPGPLQAPRASLPTGPALLSPPHEEGMPQGNGAKHFKDKSGKTFRYTGTSEDPTKDKNPDNWIEE